MMTGRQQKGKKLLSPVNIILLMVFPPSGGPCGLFFLSLLELFKEKGKTTTPKEKT
jgi:hypothetical protein